MKSGIGLVVWNDEASIFIEGRGHSKTEEGATIVRCEEAVHQTEVSTKLLHDIPSLHTILTC